MVSNYLRICNEYIEQHPEIEWHKLEKELIKAVMWDKSLHGTGNPRLIAAIIELEYADLLWII
jgi:hypothetical protein